MPTFRYAQQARHLCLSIVASNEANLSLTIAILTFPSFAKFPCGHCLRLQYRNTSTKGCCHTALQEESSQETTEVSHQVSRHKQHYTQYSEQQQPEALAGANIAGML